VRRSGAHNTARAVASDSDDSLYPTLPAEKTTAHRDQPGTKKFSRSRTFGSTSPTND
jgi:hypothetical protein